MYIIDAANEDDWWDESNDVAEAGFCRKNKQMKESRPLGPV